MIVNCAGCGRETPNPKFCSQSCAATANNRTKPKRKPEGKCPSCGVAISTRLKACEACLPALEEAKRLAAENALEIRGPDSTLERRVVPRMTLRAHRVLSFARVGSWGPVLDPRATCGDVIEAVLGILRDPAIDEYISPEAKGRHAAYLCELDRFAAPRYPNGQTRLHDAPASDLIRLMATWVTHCMRDEKMPLHLSYAIDTAQLVELVLCGESVQHREDRRVEHLEVKGLLDLRDEPRGGARRQRLHEFFDKGFRREVTMNNVGGVCVIARVPSGGSVTTRDDATIVESGGRFGLHIVRGHTSENPALEQAICHAKDPRAETPAYDLSPPIEFRCALLVSRVEDRRTPWDPATLPNILENRGYPYSHASVYIDVPATWFVASLEFREDDEAPIEVALPSWLPPARKLVVVGL